MKLRIHPSSPATAAPILVEAEPGELLSRAIWLSGLLQPAPLCGGLGRCGRCKVRFAPACAPQVTPGEAPLLSAGEIEAGVRLACRHQVPDLASGVLDLWPNEAVPAKQAGAATAKASTSGQAKGGASDLQSFAGPARRISPDDFSFPAKGGLLLACDLGTTAAAWQVVDAAGKVHAAGGCLNPQAGAGADVMSRLALCAEPGGKDRLAAPVRAMLAGIIRDQHEPVTGIVLSANTVMTDIFLGLDVTGLSHAPYACSHAGNEVFAVPGLPPVYVPPLPAPFVGGDAAAGLAFLEWERATSGKSGTPYVLADLGTNGEFLLVQDTAPVLLASVPLGPALEGIGPACGRLAGPETITQFSLSPFGLACKSADGRSPSASFAPSGISATGYVSLLAALLSCGVLLPQGQFADLGSLVSPLARKAAQGLDRAGRQARLNLPGGLWLEAADIEEFMKVRAAFATALAMLLERAGLGPAGIAAIHLAGALGQWSKPHDLETLGFLPAGTSSRVRSAGNSSLAGAVLLGLRPDLRSRLAKQLVSAVIVDATADPAFHDRYIGAMRLGG